MLSQIVTSDTRTYQHKMLCALFCSVALFRRNMLLMTRSGKTKPGNYTFKGRSGSSCFVFPHWSQKDAALLSGLRGGPKGQF